MTELTRKDVAELRAKYPTFKLSPEAQHCVEGKLIDPECEPLIQDEVRVFQKKRQLEESKRQLEIVDRVNGSLELLMALSQLGMNVEYGVVYSAKADFVAKVQADSNHDARVKAFIKEVLVWRRQNPSIVQNPYRAHLIQLAEESLRTVDSLMPLVTEGRFLDGLKETIDPAL